MKCRTTVSKVLRHFWPARRFMLAGLTEVLLLVVVKVHLAKVVVTVIAVPA